jgi:hypothetical protein
VIKGGVILAKSCTAKMTFEKPCFSDKPRFSQITIYHESKTPAYISKNDIKLKVEKDGRVVYSK